MSQQYFTIQKEIFEIDFSSRSTAYDLQNRISEVANQVLNRDMEAYLNKVIPEHLVYQFDQLEVDLGDIYLDNLLEELPAKFMEAFMAVLTAKLYKIDQGQGEDGARVVPVTHKLGDLLEYFLLTGRLPWWAIHNKLFDPVSVIRQMLELDRAALKAVLMKAGQMEYVRRRIVQQFDRDIIRELVQVLEPSEAAYIFAFEEDVIKVQQETHPIQVEQSAFQRSVWYFILTYLIVERGGEFNRKAFARSNLHQMAFQYNLHLHQLLQLMFDAIVHYQQRTDDHPWFSLLEIIRELAREEEGVWTLPESDDGALVKQDTLSLQRQMEIARHYLATGTVPVWMRGYELDIVYMRRLLMELARKVPGTFKQMLIQLSWNRHLAVWLYDALGKEGVKEMILVLYPGTADTLLNITATFSLLHKTKHTWSSINDRAYEDTIWQSLLFATLLSPGSLVQGKQFVVFLVNDISTSFHVPFQTVATRMLDGLRSMFRVEHMNMEHLNTMEQVLAQIQENATAQDLQKQVLQEMYQQGKEDEVADLFDGKGRTLHHLLFFILRYGSMPWWGREYTTTSPALLYQQLVSRSDRSAMLLLRYAGADEWMRQRWFSLIGTEQWIAALQPLPFISSITTALHQLGVALDAMTIQLPGIPTGKEREQLLYDTVWQLLQEQQYAAFPVSAFHTRVLLRLIGLTNDQGFSLLLALDSVLSFREGRSSMLLQVVRSLYQFQTGNELPRTTIGDASHPFIRSMLIEALPDWVHTNTLYHADSVAALKDIRGEARNRLSYAVFRSLLQFLQIGVVEGLGESVQRAERSVVLKDLLLLAYELNAVQLADMLLARGMNAYRVLQLTGLVSGKTSGVEQELFWLLQPIEKKQLTSIQVAEATAELKVEGKRARERLVMDLISEAGKPFTDDATEWEGLKAILEYYLKWDRFPPALVLPAGIGQDAVLKHLLYYAAQRHLDALLQLFAHPLLSPYAASAVFSVLLTDDDPQMRGLLAALKRQSGFMKRIRTIPGKQAGDMVELAASLHKAVSDRAAVDLLLGSLQVEEVVQDGYRIGREQLPQLLEQLKGKDAWLVVLATLHYRAVYDIVMQNAAQEQHAGWYEDNYLLEQLLAGISGDSLQRERLLEFVRYFNLRMVLDKQQYADSQAYFRALFAFLLRAQPQYVDTLQRLYEDLEVKITQGETSLPTQVYALAQGLKEQLVAAGRMEEVAKHISSFFEEQYMAVTSRDQQQEVQKLKEMVARELEKADEEKRREEVEQGKEKLAEKQVRVLVPNAGLVILHPFLSTYFTRLGLMENSEFLSLEKQERAVLLLQYLATGRDSFEEHELVLNKVLCGMYPEHPVAFEISVTEQEAAMSQELFDVLKQRWDKVKNSSVESIRASFIQREGILELNEEQYFLKVEQRGYDLLLQTLPWSFGFIKTKWMHQILSVEWI